MKILLWVWKELNWWYYLPKEFEKWLKGR